MLRQLLPVLLFFSSFTSQAAGKQIQFTEQPHATSIWKDSVQISWSTNIPSVGVALVNENKRSIIGGDFNDRFSGGIVTEHSLILKNLQPGHIYKVLVCALGDDTAWSQEKYIATQSASTGKFTVYFTSPVDTSASTGVNATYLNNVVDDTLVQYINRAIYSLDIAIYNTTNSSSVADIAGALNSAHARGIRIRVIYDGSVTNTMIPNLDTAIKRMASPQGSPYNIMHNKFVVIDADANNPNLSYVWTGSTNWTTSQINGTDKNNVIIIQDQSLAQAYKTEFEEMWGDTGSVPNPNTAKFGPYKTDNTPHLFNIGGKTVECYFSPSDNVNTHLLNTIGTTNTDMEFATMVITRTDIADSIVAKVNASIFHTYGLVDDSVQTSTWSILKSGMLPHTMVSHTGQTGIMHNKYLIVDQSDVNSDPLVWTGSHNWSTAANTQNDENTVVVHDDTIANIYYQNFVHLFTQHGGIMGVNEIATDDFGVYPNPSTGNVTLSLEKDGKVKLFNLLGSEIGSWNFESGLHNIDISSFAKGIYLLRFTSADQSFTEKLVIE